MYRIPFPRWACDVLVLPARGDKTPSWVLPRVLVVPADSVEEEGFTRATADEAVMFLINQSLTPPASTDRVEVPDTHPMRGLWQVEGKPAPWPLGVQVNLRRIHG